MGVLDYLANFCTVTSTWRKRKPFRTVDIKVKMDCDGCERKVRNAVKSMKGARTVEVIRKQHRVKGDRARGSKQGAKEDKAHRKEES
ncbi:Heavy metal-associated isoprenylated plant protein 21 [Ancistrocladus abbreviatus]